MKKILDEIQTTKEDGPAGGEAAVGDITDYTPGELHDILYLF